MINVKKLIFLFLSLVAFATPVFAEEDPRNYTDPFPQVENIDPKAVADVPWQATDSEGNVSPWATRVPSVTFVAGAYKELYENKVGDVVRVPNAAENSVNDGNIITNIDVQEINGGDEYLNTRRIQYSRDNVKIPVKGNDNQGWDSTNYTTIWVE